MVAQFTVFAGTVYLSLIIDYFNGTAVSHALSTSPNAERANTMLKEVIATLRPFEKPLIHMDCGCHYRWPGWIDICEKTGLVRSTSKKACSPDSSACEGFFGRLKNEMFYDRNWSGISIERFRDQVNEYTEWYNSKRIKRSLGSMSPLNYRRSLGLVI
jgi:transposase InsO family protein